MSGLTPEQIDRLADALHDDIDGDFLTDAGLRIGLVGKSVAIADASPKEVVWWAVRATSPVVAALIAEAVEEARGEVAAAIHEKSKTIPVLTGESRRRRLAYLDAARIARGEVSP